MVAVETDCMAGVRGLELRNVVANYPFERSRRFPGLKPNSGHGDYSRFELRRYGYAAKSQWLEFKARAIACYQAASPALARICGTTRLMPLPCRPHWRACRTTSKRALRISASHSRIGRRSAPPICSSSYSARSGDAPRSSPTHSASAPCSN
jgi:hypothetical protein